MSDLIYEDYVPTLHPPSARRIVVDPFNPKHLLGVVDDLPVILFECTPNGLVAHKVNPKDLKDAEFEDVDIV